MEKVINSKIVVYAMVSALFFMFGTLIYVSFGKDNTSFWWLFDKLNDRLLTINLLFITSFIFRDVVYRVFSYMSVFYVILYAYYECLFILDREITPKDFTFISLLYLALCGISLTIIAYVSQRNR